MPPVTEAVRLRLVIIIIMECGENSDILFVLPLQKEPSLS